MDQDAWLIRKMKLGDDGAIETFVKKYYPKILQYCHLHIWDRGHADDAAQETFEKFFRALDGYRHYGKASNYLYVIASNVCKDYYRESGRKNFEVPVGEMPEEIVTDRTNVDRAHERIAVEMAVDGLPPELKEVAILFFFQDRKQTEIAHILGIGLPLVKYRIKRSRELLMEALGKER